MGAPSTKPKRVAVACTLPPDLAAKLKSEADARLLNASLIVERALTMYLPLLPPQSVEPNGS